MRHIWREARCSAAKCFASTSNAAMLALFMLLVAPANARLRVLSLFIIRALATLSTLTSLLLLFSSPLAAQGSPSADQKEKQAQYRGLIEKALQEYALGHWPEARVFFSDAHAVWPNARTLRGLGMTCYEERSYVEAIGYLEQALENKIQPLTPKLASEAQNILAQAKRFVASAYFETTPGSALLRVDDQPVKWRPDGAVLLDPGDHSVEASSPGFEIERRTVRAEAGRELHLEIALHPSVELQPMEADGPPQQAQPAPSTRYTLAAQTPVAAGALAAVGLAGLSTGWLFYGLRDQLRVELWELSLNQAPGFEQAKYQQFQMRGSVAIAATSIGAVMMSAAQYFYLPDEEPVPAWAWVAGSLGGAIALGALGWGAFGRHCDISDSLAFCRTTFADELFAPMLALQALPLLSLPIMYAIRTRVPLQDSIMTLAVSDGVSLSFAGRF
jgi:tetratricopeptide (TPR) repeat protein